MAAVPQPPVAFAKQIKVAITGAVGNIGYALAFMIGQGHALGAQQPILLHLIVSAVFEAASRTKQATIWRRIFQEWKAS